MARKIQARSRTPEPKPGQSSEDYWREREARQRAANIHDEARYAAKINSIFQTTQDNIQQEIESFYARYAAKEGIDIAEARKRVSQIDMEKYERLAEQYVKAAHEGGREAAFSDEANEQMRLYNATMRINRLEMLKARCGIRAMEGYRLTEQLINDKLEERAYAEYERLAGILGNSVQFNENMVRSIVNASYQNATWSQRLWRKQALLSEQIGAQLVQGILTGKSSMVLARNIQKLTGGSAYACQRLMRTELRRVQTAAAEQSMRDNGVKEYKFMVENAVNPCDDCLDLDGEVFRLDDMAVGKNAPPVHPNCHCSTAPYVDEEKWQRWIESGMKEPWGEFESGDFDTGRQERLQKHKEERSIASQTEGEADIPASMIGDYSDFSPLELDTADYESLSAMHNMALKNQYEYGQILYDEGQTELLTDKKYDKIHLPVEQTKGSNLRVYHSHTNNTPPSSADFRALTLEKVKRIGVISGNGDTWIVEIDYGYRPTLDELDNYLDGLERTLPFELMNHPSFYDWTPEERNYMLIREKFYRVTKEFGWKAMGGSINEYK